VGGVVRGDIVCTDFAPHCLFEGGEVACDASDTPTVSVPPQVAMM